MKRPRKTRSASRRAAPRAPERRRRAAGLGAHPERRLLAPARRAILRIVPRGPRRLACVLPPIVNLFERPDAGSPVVSQATLGAAVVLLEASRAFHLVATEDGYRGWIRSAALRPMTGGASYPRPGRAWRVKNFMCQVYAARDVTSASPIATAPLLARLEVVADGSEWKRIRLPDGRPGWAQAGDLEPVPAATQAARGAGGAAVAKTALRFLGLPYVWGGTTPFGFDCSGLTQMVYRLHGRLLPRDADLQYAHGDLRPVERAGLMAGDLVFFGPRGAGITHVGIALSRREFVSATTYRSPTVRVDRLDDPYWKRLYRGARRPPGRRALSPFSRTWSS